MGAAIKGRLTQTKGRDIFAGASMPKLDTVMALERGLGRPAGWLSGQVAAKLANQAQQGE